MKTTKITINDRDLMEYLTKKYGSWGLFQEEYRRREKSAIENGKIENGKIENEKLIEITRNTDITFFKEYICDEVDDSIIEVISFECDWKYGTTYLVEYTKEVK